jgi:ADP-ribose pyrophosphatase
MEEKGQPPPDHMLPNGEIREEFAQREGAPEVKITKKETVFEGQHLRFVKKHFQAGGDKEAIWETIERKNIYHKGAVVIVASTRKGELILERNWRAPLESFVIQFPAGLTDREGESEEEVARRELLEETGYKAGKLIPVIAAPLSPALTPTRAAHFFAPEVEFVGKQDRDIAERIEVLRVPVKKLNDFLLNLPQDTELDLRVPGILWILEREKLI